MSSLRVFAPLYFLVAVAIASFPVGLLTADWLGFGRAWILRLLVALWFTVNAGTLYSFLFLKAIPDSWLEADVRDASNGPHEGSNGIGLDHSAIFSATAIIDPGPVNKALFDAIQSRGGVWFVQPAIFEVATRSNLTQVQPRVLTNPGLTVYLIHEQNETKERVSTKRAVEIAAEHERFGRPRRILIAAHLLQAARALAITKKAFERSQTDVVVAITANGFNQNATSWQNRSREIYVMWELIARIKSKLYGEM